MNLARRYAAGWDSKANDMAVRRMEAWGLNTARSVLSKEKRMPYPPCCGAPQTAPVYRVCPMSTQRSCPHRRFLAASQLASLKDDRICWITSSVMNPRGRPGARTGRHDPGRARRPKPSAGLNAFLTPATPGPRRREFVLAAFEHQLQITNRAPASTIPTTLTSEFRFGALPPDDVIRLGRLFDVYSHNIYEYTPDREWGGETVQASPASRCSSGVSLRKLPPGDRPRP